MTKGRLEAFSDGVLAIIMTVMVLELRTPEGTDWSSLIKVAPKLLTYALSFVFLGIYWSNHHHLFQAVKHVNGRVLWANLHLLFWLSLIPFVTDWVGDKHFAAVPVSVYGIVLLLSAIGYFFLTRALLSIHAKDSPLAVALGADFKGKISVVIYAAAIGFSYLDTWIAFALYIVVAVMWLIPDRRIEKTLM